MAIDIADIERVCKFDGRVMLADKSVVMHLRSAAFSQMFLQNNSLWTEHPSLPFLPAIVADISISYILGNWS